MVIGTGQNIFAKEIGVRLTPDLTGTSVPTFAPGQTFPVADRVTNSSGVWLMLEDGRYVAESIFGVVVKVYCSFTPISAPPPVVVPPVNEFVKLTGVRNDGTTQDFYPLP